ncbi:ABC transporter permease [Paracoccus sp. IB05]|uniref:ABC transporter permease n=1 Tax=Paracoccus sp. IB05 TaxID=2779367 RepID=UPI0018E7D2D1|nr:ABC transporter permease [Paracoccus sp. IB05]MBJ2150235.1 ABC transporter permease [Paracoccus sp. IB05]
MSDPDPLSVPPVAGPGPRRSRRARIRAELKRAPLSAWFGGLVILAYVVLAVFAPLIAPWGEATVAGQPHQAWGGDFLLGTDQLGRDVLSRLIYGARNTLGIAVLTTCLAFLTGGLLGILAALYGGWFDQICSRIVDVFMSIPSLIFALLFLSVFGSSIPNLIITLAALDATRVFRLARAAAGTVVVLDYIQIARVRGESLLWLIRREILPNILSPMIVEFGLRFCFVFLSIAALSFLGVGIQPPTADWGSMVRENAALISYGNITALLPAAAIALLTVAVNFVIDWYVYRTSGMRDER